VSERILATVNTLPSQRGLLRKAGTVGHFRVGFTRIRCKSGLGTMLTVMTDR
jgi:hypothetical protein